MGFTDMADEVGLRVRNKDRVLQIDGEYQNLELVSKATYTIPVESVGGDMWGGRVDIPPPAGRLNVVMAVLTTAAAGVYTVRVGTTYRIYRGSLNGSNVVEVTVYFFATPIERDTGGVGLIVRSRVTGAVVYNSNYRYLRILKFAPVDLYVPQNAIEPPSSASFSFPGKKVAIIQCVRPNARRQTPAGTPQQYIGVFGFFGGTMRTDGATNAIIEHRVIGSAVGPWGQSTAFQTLGTYMIVDVTGM